MHIKVQEKADMTVCSLLLFSFALLASLLSLLGEQLALGLVPVPLFLDVLGSYFHVDLFLQPFLFLLGVFFVEDFLLSPLFVLLLHHLLHIIHLLVGFFLLELNILLILGNMLILGLSQLITSIVFSLDFLLFCGNEGLNLLAHFALDFEVVLQFGNLVSQSLLLHGLEALHTGQLACDFSLLILNLKLSLSLCLVKPCLLLGDLITSFLCLLSKAVLLCLKVIVDLLDFCVKLLLLAAKLVELLLLFKITVNSVLEADESLAFSHFFHNLFNVVFQLGLVALDQVLVIFDFGIVFQLASQFSS